MRRNLLLIGICLLTLAVYLPGVRGPFVFDDFPNIVDNTAATPNRFSSSAMADAALSGEAGPLKRPLAYVSFAVNSVMGGGVSNPAPFKLTNILIHLINTVLVYGLALRLLRLAQRPNGNGATSDVSLAALLPAAMWALHPLQAIPVLFVVQRMTSMSATFVLLGTLVFVHGRSVLATKRRSAWMFMWAGVGIGLLGLLAKENAGIATYLLLVVEYSMFNRQDCDPSMRARLYRFYAVICGLPGVLLVTWLAIHPNYIASTYLSRDFGPMERLLTEARVIWLYLGLVVVPSPDRLTLFHDDLTLSTSLLNPWTTLPAVAGLVLLLLAAIRLRVRQPLLSLAILWFLTGHLVESTLLGLELVYEHRNYLPDVFLFVALFHGMTVVWRNRWLTTAASAILILAFAGVTLLRAVTWSRVDLLIESMARNHPGSARSQAMMGELLVQRGDVPGAVARLRGAAALAPGNSEYPMRLMLVQAQFETANATSREKVDVADIPDEPRSIARDLAKRVPGGRTFDTLDALVKCAVEAPNACAKYYVPLVDWFRALFGNPAASNDVRLFAVDHALRLMLWKKDYDRALELVKQARKIDPSNGYYLIFEADIRLRQGDLVRAEEALATLTSGESPTSLQRQANDVRRRILSQRAPRQSSTP